MAAVVHQGELLVGGPIVSAMALDGSEPIAGARRAARGFMTAVQGVHGIPVSDRAMSMVELVVSELVTNAYKYAPGPCLLELEVGAGVVEISVWDTDAQLPAVSPADPSRIGQHGLEIAMAVCRSFEVRREPVGKRVKVTIGLADDPGGDPAGRLP
ncbi:ATP-binding protein [Streptomyces sp. NBC_00335]|uniref:ATP-binding protein n=1 Tax=unclassified Streptomyces TaxID=2593676 RepID=UPI0022578B2B|nr:MULTISPECIES: ATP-binding protein [unclassified Streptomyces]MCX5403058.1 ATP-binding protein [Streptomyces sp. NBC_00086]